ncbi:MAG: hypothetical protein NVS9B15_00330 [Acidobacteriaceae bacterium]
MSEYYSLDTSDSHHLITLTSEDGTNKLTRARLLALTALFAKLDARPVILTGNQRFFSAGADLDEIRALTGLDAFSFARMGQRLMNLIDEFPAPVFAAISGYCMGGGLDLALACDHRICAPNAVLAHRGAALGIMTGWGGTQRLPRSVGKSIALSMFVTGEKLSAERGLGIGLVSRVAHCPIATCISLAESAR